MTTKPITLCPICDRRTDDVFAPFCSERCQHIDLSRWFNGTYAVPAQEEDDPDDDAVLEEYPEDDLY